jgi:hypothetical protein
MQLVGSQQHSQNSVLVTLFTTWETENSLVEKNVDSTGAINGSNCLSGKKLASTCSFVGWCIVVKQ